MHIHIEESSQYRCHECRGSCNVFILARENELRLCGSCSETLREALMHAVMIPGTEQLSAPITRAAIEPSARGLQSPRPGMRTIKSRGVL